MKERMNLSFLLLNTFGFLLLLEWIWPIGALSDTSEIWIFLVFLSICFLLSFFQLPLLLNAGIKAIVILVLLHSVYFKGDLFQLQWITAFLFEIELNLRYLFMGNLPGLTHLFRSLLFLILLGLAVYLLHFWFIYRKKVMAFFLFTTVYIAVLDTFTPYDASQAIIRTVLIGFVLMGILTFHRISKKDQLDFQAKTTRKWMISLLVMLLFSVSLGYGLPKVDPIWPDPFSSIEVLGERIGEPGAKRVGYGVDDSRLGGSLTGDTSVVFKTKVESAHYWKVETKDVYTGKGWVQSQQEVEPIAFLPESRVPITSIIENGAVERNEQTSFVRQIKEYSHIVYPFGVTAIRADGNYRFELDPTIEKIGSFAGNTPSEINDYSVTFERPNYSMAALQATKRIQDTNLNKDFIDQYTQLPETLPSRVNELAVEVTRGKETWYDKAKAIEQYLKGSEFTYSLQDVAMPGDNEDYVDQFLFQSMVGYCNNFSTSMVVLLRSLDIPARWVKGYTEGEFIGFVDGMYEYEVTNNNAHAWVEVYFPLVGWVTFDPTPGFSNPIDYYVDEEENVEEMAANLVETQPEVEDETIQDKENWNGKEKNEFSLQKLWGKITVFFDNHTGWIYGFALLLLSAVAYLYKIRAKWLPLYYIRKFKRLDKNESFIDAYEVLLRQFHRSGVIREPGQTLREYAAVIDRRFATDEMTAMTAQYEKYLYGNRLETGTWEAVRELWENLIKRSAS